MEVVGIPSSVKHDQLEPTVCIILHHIGVNISGDKRETFKKRAIDSVKIVTGLL